MQRTGISIKLNNRARSREREGTVARAVTVVHAVAAYLASCWIHHALVRGDRVLVCLNLLAANLSVSRWHNLGKVLVHRTAFIQCNLHMLVKRVLHSRVLVAKRQRLDGMRHVEDTAAEPLQVVDVHVLLLKRFAWRKVEVAADFVHFEKALKSQRKNSAIQPCQYTFSSGDQYTRQYVSKGVGTFSITDLVQSFY